VTGTQRIRVDATIVECFRAWGESWRAPHPWFEIVADVKTPAGEVERITARQKLHTRGHRWRAPDPGDVVPASWDPTRRELELELTGDARYDEKLIKKLGRTRDAGSGRWPRDLPPGTGT
jgi:hypothetical protein